MPRSAILTVIDDSQDAFYQRVLTYLHNKYHNYPTTLTASIDHDEGARQSSYASLARDTARGNHSQDHLPAGKRVY